MDITAPTEPTLTAPTQPTIETFAEDARQQAVQELRSLYGRTNPNYEPTEEDIDWYLNR